MVAESGEDPGRSQETRSRMVCACGRQYFIFASKQKISVEFEPSVIEVGGNIDTYILVVLKILMLSKEGTILKLSIHT